MQLALSATQETYRTIRKKLKPHFSELARCNSTSELEALSLYASLEPLVREVLDHADVGDFSRSVAPARPQYRFVAWNLERGIQFDGQLEALRSDPYLKEADALLLTETDVGMARSGNRAVAQELARELGLHYAFVPCYLNLAKGAGVERDQAGDNELGLHGNAILSRYPIQNVRPVRLKNGKDKMSGREKRLGRQTAVVADIEFPNFPVTVASIHLDAQSTQRHRHDQMRDVLDGLATNRPRDHRR